MLGSVDIPCLLLLLSSRDGDPGVNDDRPDVGGDSGCGAENDLITRHSAPVAEDKWLLFAVAAGK